MNKKYESVIKHIEKLVSENKLKQGDRLPAIRMLADELQCNKATIIRAYRELEENHKIYSIPKSGYYLVEKSNKETKIQKSINFAEVLPDPKLLPYKEFNHCINKAIELYKDKLFSYSDAQGLHSLRKILVSHFADNQIFTSSDDIYVTSGAQQALSILSAMKYPNNKSTILVEQPTYSLMQRMIELYNIRLIGIKRNHKGIDIKLLERLFRDEDIKYFYTIPRLHNPLGSSYTEKEKIKIAELAAKHDVYIIEDDYLADIEAKNKSMPIHYYDTYDKVIYVKSFSKAFMPGIRLGALVLPKELKQEFLQHKRLTDLNTSVIAQGALEIYINSGMYKNHIRRVQKLYKGKMQFLKEYLKSCDMDEIELHIPDTGFFIWLKLPDKLDTDKLIKELRNKSIYIYAPSNFYINQMPQENCIRLCVSQLELEEIRTGINIIIKEINRLTSN